MAEIAEFTIGARAYCTDGFCGEVRRLVVNPATDAVTHLVIRPVHRREEGRLVPVRLVDTTDGEIRLRCTRAEFDRLDHAEQRDVVEDLEGVGSGGLLGDEQVYGAGGEAYGLGATGQEIPIGPQPVRRRTVLQDVVPLGETEVSPGDSVHAVDGEIGRVQGFIVDPHDDRVTHVLLQEGHLWGRKEVAIPISAVTGVADGIRLNITKEQVRDLPPAPAHSLFLDHVRAETHPAVCAFFRQQIAELDEFIASLSCLIPSPAVRRGGVRCAGHWLGRHRVAVPWRLG